MHAAVCHVFFLKSRYTKWILINLWKYYIMHVKCIYGNLEWIYCMLYCLINYVDTHFTFSPSFFLTSRGQFDFVRFYYSFITCGSDDATIVNTIWRQRMIILKKRKCKRVFLAILTQIVGRRRNLCDEKAFVAFNFYLTEKKTMLADLRRD